MIVDVHCHAFGDGSGIGDPFKSDSNRAHGGAEVSLDTSLERYFETSPADTRTVVIGGKARRSGLWVDDATIAATVAEAPDRLIGYCAIDPTQPGWADELRFGREELGLRGVKIMPMYAGFDPADPAYDDFWTYVTRHAMPVLAHTGTTFVSAAPLRWGHPEALDEVAMRHPEARIVLAHLGHPFEGECLAVIRKHANVYADVSALHYRPFQLWHSLRLAQDYGVFKKILFGSDYPFTTVDESVEGLRRIAAVPGIPGLDPLDRDAVEAIIDRDSLALLQLS